MVEDSGREADLHRAVDAREELFRHPAAAVGSPFMTPASGMVPRPGRGYSNPGPPSYFLRISRKGSVEMLCSLSPPSSKTAKPKR